MQVQTINGALLGSVAELADAYLRDKGFGPKSSAAVVLRRIVAVLGGRAVGDLGAGVLNDYRDKRLLTVKPPTVRRELVQLKAALEWGRSSGVVPHDCRPVVSLPPEGSPRTSYMDETQEARMWDAAYSLFMDPEIPFRFRRIGLFVCIALETAARDAAVRGLEWSRADMRRGVLDFRDPGMVVTKKRRVPVPISDRLRPVLERAYAERKPGEIYILGHSGAVRTAYENFRDRIGLGWVTIHDLRRTWASLRVQWGVPIYEVAGVLGDTVEVVEKHYACFAPGYLRSAVNMRPVGQASGLRIAAE